MTAGMKVVLAPQNVRRIVNIRMPVLLAAIGAEYTKNVKLAMRNSPRSGPNTNPRGQKRSGPGEPPAPFTGDLIKSIRFQVRQSGDHWMVEMGSTLRKAVYLEFGAARGRVMQARDMSGRFTKAKTMSWILYPRPVWGPELLKLRSRIPQIINRFAARGGRRAR